MKTGAAPITRQFFLNLPATEGRTVSGVPSDGNDAIFGDLGNDWLVGGTGRDDLYAGWGNDLLQADDVLTTNNNLNDHPRTNASWEDRAYGGAGIDILIANTGGDRLIDWVGSELVPRAVLAVRDRTVSRRTTRRCPSSCTRCRRPTAPIPTRDTDTGRDPRAQRRVRGELGLIRQRTTASGSSRPAARPTRRPGNIPGGSRDVLRGADFNDGTLTAFAVDSGVWAVASGTARRRRSSLGKDAAAVLYLDDYQPIFYEVTANVRAKPTAGWKANAYILFDYWSPTDFKFAGIDICTNKIVIGHRNAAGLDRRLADAAHSSQARHGLPGAARRSTARTVQRLGRRHGGRSSTRSRRGSSTARAPTARSPQQGPRRRGLGQLARRLGQLHRPGRAARQTFDRNASFTGGDDPFGDVASGAWVAAGGAYGATAARDGHHRLARRPRRRGDPRRARGVEVTATLRTAGTWAGSSSTPTACRPLQVRRARRAGAAGPRSDTSTRAAGSSTPLRRGRSRPIRTTRSCSR